MGRIHYGGTSSPIQVEDRTLAHLTLVMTTKLRRGESFTVSWPHCDDEPTGRSSIWIHPAIALRFDFDGSEPPTLNRQYLMELARSASSTEGIRLTAEDMGRRG
ncbi:DUF7882 family protein [Microbacterium resistens]